MMRKKMYAVLTVILCAVLFCAVPAVNAEGSEKPSYTVDFGNKGYCICQGGFTAEMLLGQFSERMKKVEHGDVFDFQGVYQMDVDGDGTYDVVFAPRQYTEYGMAQTFAVPLPGNSLRNTVTLKGTDADGFKSVTFKPAPSGVKEEYTIKLNGCKAYKGQAYNEGEKEYVVKAEPGMLISVEVSECPSGKYLKNWQSDNMNFPTDYYFTYYCRCFIMPAHDVTVNAVFAPQETATINVTDNEDPMTDDEIVSIIGAMNIEDAAGLYDLDGDGTYDIEFIQWGDSRRTHAVPFRSVKDTFTLKLDAPGLRYNRIVLNFKDGRIPYEIDLSSTIKNWGNYYRKPLSEWLKTYELADKPYYYDIDRDGNADFWVLADERWSEAIPLPTYSLGKAYSVPADDVFGAGKKITFKCSKAPEFHTVSLSVGEGGKAELFFRSSYVANFDSVERGTSEDTILLVHGDEKRLFRAVEGNRITAGMYAYVVAAPEDGYQLAEIAGSDNAQQENENLFLVNGDAEITVTFEKLPQPTVTPTPTATPVPTAAVTAVPSPTGEDPVKEPTQGATEEPVKGETDKEKKSVIPIVLIILSAVVAVSAAAGFALYLRSRNRIVETEPEERDSAHGKQQERRKNEEK